MQFGVEFGVDPSAVKIQGADDNKPSHSFGDNMISNRFVLLKQIPFMFCATKSNLPAHPAET